MRSTLHKGHMTSRDYNVIHLHSFFLFEWSQCGRERGWLIEVLRISKRDDRGFLVVQGNKSYNAGPRDAVHAAGVTDGGE